jgi:hypothetical protein
MYVANDYDEEKYDLETKEKTIKTLCDHLKDNSIQINKMHIEEDIKSKTSDDITLSSDNFIELNSQKKDDGCSVNKVISDFNFSFNEKKKWADMIIKKDTISRQDKKNEHDQYIEELIDEILQKESNIKEKEQENNFLRATVTKLQLDQKELNNKYENDSKSFKLKVDLKDLDILDKVETIKLYTEELESKDTDLNNLNKLSIELQEKYDNESYKTNIYIKVFQFISVISISFMSYYTFLS